MGRGTEEAKRHSKGGTAGKAHGGNGLNSAVVL